MSSIKVFISYSHKDEEHKDALDEQLSMLKRNKLIDAWHDRKISPGDNWADEISEHLEQSDLILFLLSPSFLASDYCHNIEMNRAIEMHSEGKTQLIPILVRPCDWSSTQLSRLQALPKDAVPITKWGNQDDAWLNVINGIKSRIVNFKPLKPTIQSSIVSHETIQLADSVLSWLDDTEVVLTHRKVNKVTLSDIYVALDMNAEDVSEAKDLEIASSETVINKPNRYLISGEEQQGKSSLLKHAYKALLKAEALVVHLNAREINQSDIRKSITPALKSQYTNLEVDQFLAAPNKVLLIDDINEIALNSKYRSSFLASINENFTHVIITTQDSFSYIAAEIPELNEYQRYSLLGLGHIKRTEIIEKWVSLGVEESIDDRELYSQSDDIKARLDTIIRKNIVPPKPIYILMLLQMFEAYAQQNLELSSHGHCYQQLIYRAFDHAGIPKTEVDKYLNVLTELSWVLLRSGGALNQHQLESFFKDYTKIYLGVDEKKVISNLKSNAILLEKDFRIQFKYPYLFYFFVAKKIAESYSTDDEAKKVVEDLINNLHREDYANILVFVTHHTKEAWVLEKIETALGSLYSDQQPATLSKDQLSFMDEFIAKIPDLVMEQRVIRDEREKHNQNLDSIDREDESDEAENPESADILASINKAFKGMEISGQIIRNRHATLTRDALFGLASNGAFTGLRFLNFFLQMTETSKSEVIKYVEKKIREHPGLSDEKIQDFAKEVFLLMTYGVINGTIRKIASSIGSKEAGEIYKQIQKEEQSPALVLLNQAIELHFGKSLEMQSVSNTASLLKNNPVCSRILTELIIQHTYMFPVDYKEKQQLAELLRIPVQGQRIMDRQSKIKG